MARGAYSIRILLALIVTAGTAAPGAAIQQKTQETAEAVPTTLEERSTTPTVYGTMEVGQLQDGDGELQAGEFRDLYTFEGEIGDPITIELRSDEFLPYLAVIAPSGRVLRNHNWKREKVARIEVRLREEGRYQVIVTSFAPGERGAYALLISDRRVKIAD